MLELVANSNGFSAQAFEINNFLSSLFNSLAGQSLIFDNLLDESYRAQIVTDSEEAPDFSASQFYENIINDELRRSIEREENFTPGLVFQTRDAIYLTDGEHGKLSRFNSQESLKTIAVFGGKLKKLKSINVDAYGNICILIQSSAEHQNNYLVKLSNF